MLKTRFLSLGISLSSLVAILFSSMQVAASIGDPLPAVPEAATTAAVESAATKQVEWVCPVKVIGLLEYGDQYLVVFTNWKSDFHEDVNLSQAQAIFSEKAHKVEVFSLGGNYSILVPIVPVFGSSRFTEVLERFQAPIYGYSEADVYYWVARDKYKIGIMPAEDFDWRNEKEQVLGETKLGTTPVGVDHKK